MNMTLKPKTEARISEIDDAEFRDIEAAIAEGLAQAAREEGISLEGFDRTMRAKYGIEPAVGSQRHRTRRQLPLTRLR